MNDESKSPDTGHVDETFNEDFDFGEGETASHPIKTTTTTGRSKKIIGFIFFAVVIIVLAMGYRAYHSKFSSLKNSSNTAPLTKQPALAATPPSIPSPKNINPSPKEIKKQSDELAAAFEGITPTPPADPADTLVSPESKPAITSMPTTAPIISAIPAPAPAPAPLNVPEAEKILPEEAETTKLHEGLNKLNNQIDSILSQIKYLDAYSREVSDNLNKLNESISTMDTRLLTLTNTTSTLSKDVGAVKSEVGQVKEVLREDGLDINLGSLSGRNPVSTEKAGRIVIAEPEYTVHAVVPGRAWLKSTKGQIVTVAEGDSIGNYGKILVIDAANGVVLTSSGVAFR